mmetsp:Transcript_24/g.124  ORF Transcript_24/g.124 Transcript_24/m.124 type:complete len:225 (+) Transcript_24:35-709(+)
MAKLSVLVALCIFQALPRGSRAFEVIRPVPPVQKHSRREFFLDSVKNVQGISAVAATVAPSSAYAKYGDAPKTELPNYIEFLNEKNNQGFVADPDKVLYKGADPTVLLRRIQQADERLAEIDSLIEQKKWSQIEGLVLGPLGTLSQTVNQILATLPQGSDGKAAKKSAQKLKGDLIAIGQAASKKNAETCRAATNETTLELETFVKAVYCQSKTMVCFDTKELR